MLPQDLNRTGLNSFGAVCVPAAEPLQDVVMPANENDRELVDILMDIAKDEIERTSAEAVKACAVEMGGEITYWKSKCEILEGEKAKLCAGFDTFKNSVNRQKHNFFWRGTGIGLCCGLACAFLLLYKF